MSKIAITDYLFILDWLEINVFLFGLEK